RSILRALHFFEENKRVEKMLEALEADDMKRYLELVNESGESSFCFLQNLYPSIDPTEQGLSLAIALSKRILQGQGAVRVHGGGFAGTIQAYVPIALFNQFTKRMEKVFGEGSITALAIRKAPTTALIY
ncbi:MAG: galactokinase, partial [Spirochaetales bacterium]|nr:galactokinase [Spirochaetales bacterium]